jgi:hypothetical protein
VEIHPQCVATPGKQTKTSSISKKIKKNSAISGVCLFPFKNSQLFLRALLLFNYFVLRPTDAQLFHKLSHPYSFRHYRVILRQLVINTLPNYTSISNAAVGNTI